MFLRITKLPYLANKTSYLPLCYAMTLYIFHKIHVEINQNWNFFCQTYVSSFFKVMYIVTLPKPGLLIK